MSQETSTSGPFDPTFNGNGVLNLPIPEISGFLPSAVLALPEGKLLVVIALLGSGAGYAVARLNEQGALDKEFGENSQGFVIVPLEESTELSIWGISPTANGGWLIFGQSTSAGSSGLLVVRQFQDGKLDTSLNGTGILLIPYNDFGNSGHTGITVGAAPRNEEEALRTTGKMATSVVAQPNGKIVLVSSVKVEPFTYKGIVLRRNSDGSRDKTFNETGFAIVELADVAHDWNSTSGVAVQADNQVLVCGSFFSNDLNAPQGAFVTRFNALGKVDTGFNAGRTVTLSNPSEIKLDAITVRESDGRIVAVGRARPRRGEAPKGLMVVLNASGSFNLPFNNGQPLFSDLVPEKGMYWLRCALQADGSIIVAGDTGNGFVTENLSAVTARYRSDGLLDLTFNNGEGFTVFNDEQRIEGAIDMTVMEDGRIVVCGSYYADAEPWPYLDGGWVLRYLA